MTREEAFSLVTDWTKTPGLINHMLAVEIEMRALACHFGEDENLWGLAGLLHDADYEQFKSTPELHPSRIFDELESRSVDQSIITAIKAHAWQHQDHAPKPESKMDWCLFTCDDLSGFIIACALVRPEKKLSSVTLESMKKKWKEKSFAAGADREKIHFVEENLGLSTDEYMSICLKALQDKAEVLGL